MRPASKLKAAHANYGNPNLQRLHSLKLFSLESSITTALKIFVPSGAMEATCLLEQPKDNADKDVA